MIKHLEEDTEVIFLPSFFAMRFWVSHQKQRQQLQNKQVEPHQTPKKGTTIKSNDNLQIGTSANIPNHIFDKGLISKNT